MNINTSTNNLDISSNLRQLLVKLEFIGKIEAGQKPNMYKLTMSDSASWLDSFYRNFTGENSINMAHELEIILSECQTNIDRYQNDIDIVQLITNKLSNYRNGIKNLLVTYNSKTNISCRLEVLLNTTDILIKKLSDKNIKV
jgi:hypothetical protein